MFQSLYLFLLTKRKYFLSIGDVAKCYPLAKSLARWYPRGMFDHLLTQAFQKVELNLNTVNVLPQVSCPVLIFHAEDDPNVSISLGEKHYDVIFSYVNIIVK